MYITFESVHGIIKVSGCERYIRRIEVVKEKIPQFSGELAEHFLVAKKQLLEFFNGDRESFELSLETSGSDFQNSVWKAMQDIPFGETRTYGEIGKMIGNPRAYQAIGSACGKNPIPFVIPCHRVVGSKGIGGFALGLDSKKKLLVNEGLSY